jgi:hypothetical protein
MKVQDVNTNIYLATNQTVNIPNKLLYQLAGVSAFVVSIEILSDSQEDTVNTGMMVKANTEYPTTIVKSITGSSRRLFNIEGS